MSDSSGSEDERSRLLEAVKGVPTTRELPAAGPINSAQYSSARATGGHELVVSEDVQIYLTKKLAEYIERMYEGSDQLWRTQTGTAANPGGVKLLAASLLPVQMDQPPPTRPLVRKRRHSSTTSTDSEEDVRLKEAAVEPQDILVLSREKPPHSHMNKP